MKRCGKSAPGRARARSHAKPHLEKDQIDAWDGTGPVLLFLTEEPRMGRSFEPSGDGRPRLMTVIPDAETRRGDRTRLMRPDPNRLPCIPIARRVYSMI